MTPYSRIALYNVTQFLPAGAAHAYAGIWLAAHGLSGWEIGVVTTFPIVLILLSNVFVGRLADKARDWRSALQICSAAFVVFTILMTSHRSMAGCTCKEGEVARQNSTAFPICQQSVIFRYILCKVPVVTLLAKGVV